jgi:hypothetical protein
MEFPLPRPLSCLSIGLFEATQHHRIGVLHFEYRGLHSARTCEMEVVAKESRGVARRSKQQDHLLGFIHSSPIVDPRRINVCAGVGGETA